MENTPDNTLYEETQAAETGNSAKPVRHRNKGRGVKPVFPVILALIAFISIACNIFLIVRYRFRIEFYDGKPTILSGNQYDALKRQTEKQISEEITNKTTNNILDTVRTRLTAGDSTMYLLRQYYPDYTVYMSDGYCRFSKTDTALKANTLKNEYFKTTDSGDIAYKSDSTSSVKGIDVSVYQGDIDWSSVKADGVDYAMIRCGYRGYNNGFIQKDIRFTDNITNATANSVEAGVYFFSQAVTKEEAIEEANYVIDAIKPYNVTYPVAIDIEDIANAKGRQESLTAAELTEVVIAFCETVKAAGYTPMIYSNIAYFMEKVEYSRLEDYSKWYASYQSQLYFPYEISMWQYTNTGRVNGISGDVDINIQFK